MIICLPRASSAAEAATPEQQPTPSQLEFFEAKIRPVLSQQCYKCHSLGSGKSKGNLRVDTREAIRRGGDSGQAVVPHNVGLSKLIHAIRHDGPEMPKDGEKLADHVIADFEHWIDMGAPDPRDEALIASATQPAANPVEQPAKPPHWAFQPPQRPRLPAVKQKQLVRTPVDRFLLARLEQDGQTYSAPADPRVLVRRLYFDLIGLPPTPQQVDDFVNDKRPDAYERLVEQLLASPHYGERWGRHWLDAAGWSESTLLISDRLRQGFWRYRDYVINSFNDDKPYDRFVTEQLAGDELQDWRHEDNFDPKTVENLTATGFLRCVPDGSDNQFIAQEDKMFPAQQSAVEVATKCLMGLTLNCTRCHDHKFDPILQEEYYGLIAVFGGAYDVGKWIPGMDYDLAVGPVRAIPLLDAKGRTAFQKHMDDIHAECDELQYKKRTGLEFKYRDQYLAKNLDRLGEKFDRATVQQALTTADRSRTQPQQDLLLNAAVDLGASLEMLKKTYPQLGEELRANQKRDKAIGDEVNRFPEMIWALWDVSTNPTPVHLLQRGDFTRPGKVVEPGIIKALDDPAHPWQPPTPPAHGQSTGRRLAFAQWLTRPNHPLTSRVMVNRIWQYHFGTGIVASTDDFGRRGTKPTHPELLDWLATEFINPSAGSGAAGASETGDVGIGQTNPAWSIKHLHRLIVNSTAYRQSSLQPTNGEPANPSLLAIFPRRRLEAEPLRDAMLSASGLLDLKMGGPSIMSKQYSDGSYVVNPDDPRRHCRSVYLTSTRTQIATLMGLFDEPTMDTNWPKRNDSAIPAQALALMNHPEVLEYTNALAQRVCREANGTDQRLDLAFRLTLGRTPDAAERGAFAAEVQKLSESGESGEKQAWELVAHALLSSNEFMYVD